jgi:hypothetical protein
VIVFDLALLRHRSSGGTNVGAVALAFSIKHEITVRRTSAHTRTVL